MSTGAQIFSHSFEGSLKIGEMTFLRKGAFPLLGISPGSIWSQTQPWVGLSSEEVLN